MLSHISRLFRNSVVKSRISWRWRSSLCAGQKIHGFSVDKVDPVKDFNMDLVFMRHVKSGARLLHLARPDPNCVFGIAFPTVPSNDKGTPHILEHMVLCGSKRFPCRDPFFKMLTRSVANFLNAMTFPQYTMFLFSTENQKDYLNLMDVYFDATFQPLLNRLDFLQEAWRLETKDNEHPEVQGVVYNEMKGVMSDPLEIFNRQTMKTLHGYSDSGGNPSDIVELDLDELQKFHHDNYALPLARFVTYGNVALDIVLSRIDSLIDGCPHIECDLRETLEWPSITPSSSQVVHIDCPKDSLTYDPRRPFTFARSFSTGSIRDSWNCFLLKVLSSLLFDCEGSPLYRNLIASGIASSLLPHSGINADTLETNFDVGLQGVSDTEEARSAIDKSLREIASSGFAKEDVEAALQKLELSARQVGGSFGTRTSIAVVGPWLYGVDLAPAMRISEQIQKFRRLYEQDPRILENKLEKMLIENNVWREVVMCPSDQYSIRKAKEEKERVSRLVSNFGKSKLVAMQNDIVKMRDYQAQMEDASCLPQLHLSEINPEREPYKWHFVKHKSAPLFAFPQQTNGLVYFRHVFTGRFPGHLIPYLPIFSSVFARLGTERLTYWELSQAFDMVSSGMSVSPMLNVHPTKTDHCEMGILLSSHCLRKNLGKTLALWYEVLTDFPRVLAKSDNVDRLKTLIREAAVDALSDLTESGNYYASIRARSQFNNEIVRNEESTYGLKQVELLQKLRDEEELSKLIGFLSEIYQIIYAAKHRSAIHYDTEESDVEGIIDNVENAWLRHTASSESGEPIWSQTMTFQGDCSLQTEKYHIEADVNYCAAAYKLTPKELTIEDKASLKVASSLLTTKWLLPLIRERNGAYGASAGLSSDGFVCMTSYRDPRGAQTLDDFGRSLRMLIDGQFTEEDLHNAKLRTIQEIDKPISPSGIGLPLFLRGVTASEENNMRRAVLSLSSDGLRNCLQRTLSNAKFSSCIVGSNLD